MEFHQRTMAMLHVLYASLMLALLLVCFLIFGAVFSITTAPARPGLFFANIGLFMGLFALLYAGQLTAALLFLRGQHMARNALLGFGALALLNFPFGSALGVYTLWALMRRRPVSTFSLDKQPPAGGV
jgi:hypothetical protein